MGSCWLEKQKSGSDDVDACRTKDVHSAEKDKKARPSVLNSPSAEALQHQLIQCAIICLMDQVPSSNPFDKHPIGSSLIPFVILVCFSDSKSATTKGEMELDTSRQCVLMNYVDLHKSSTRMHAMCIKFSIISFRLLFHKAVCPKGCSLSIMSQ